MFAVFWILFILSDYLVRSPFYFKALDNNFYLFVFIVVSLALVPLLLSFKGKFSVNSIHLKPINGLKIYAVLLGLEVFIFTAYSVKFDLLQGFLLEGVFKFLFKNIIIHLEIFLLLLAAYSVGNLAIRRIIIPFSKPLGILLSLAVGIIVITLLMMMAGFFNWLNMWFMIVMVTLLLGMNINGTLTFLKRVFKSKTTKTKIHILHFPALVILLIFIATNLVSVIRPLPIGFDSMNLYINNAQLISEYNSLVQGGQAYNWTLFVSSGLVFYKNIVVTLTLSMLPGILSAITVFFISRKVTTPGWSLTIAALFYSLPFILWQSINELKTDLGLLLFLLLSVYAYIEFHQLHKAGRIKVPLINGSKGIFNGIRTAFHNPYNLFWILIGVLLGYSFGIKYTSAIFILALFSIVLFRSAGFRGLFTGYFITIASIYIFKLYGFSIIGFDPVARLNLIYVSGGLAAIAFVYSFIKDRKGILAGMKNLLIIGLFAGLVFVPWMYKNYSEHGVFSVDNLLIGKKALPELTFEISRFGENPETPVDYKFAALNSPLALNYPISKTVFKLDWIGYNNIVLAQHGNRDRSFRDDQGIGEEVNRFMGYQGGLARYFTLPYDLTMRGNVNLFANDISYLFLLILPLLPILLFRKKTGLIYLNIILAVVFLSVSFFSLVYFSNYNTQSANDYYLYTNQIFPGNIQNLSWDIAIVLSNLLEGMRGITDPIFKAMLVDNILIVHSLVYLIPVIVLAGLYFGGLWHEKGLMLPIAILAIISCTFWLILGSGIAWYGYIGFTLFLILAITSIFKERKLEFTGKLIKYAVGAGLGFWMLLIFAVRMDNTNPIESPYSTLFIQDYFYFKAGIFNEQETINGVLGDYLPAVQAMNADPEAYIIRVGTFGQYFIQHNDRRVYIDNQLNIINSVLGKVSNKDQANFYFRKAGIKYILFALNVGFNDVTPERSVVKKATALFDYLSNNPKIRLIATDRLVIDPNGTGSMYINNRQVRVSKSIFGELASNGNFALIEILD